MNGDIQQLVEQAARALRAAGAREVYLFGSAAAGTMRGGSDIDLAVSGLPPEAFFSAMGVVSDVLGRPVTLVDLDEDNPFTRYLKEAGELQRVG
jgi:predicted nucleotidyltransferase